MEGGLGVGGTVGEQVKQEPVDVLALAASGLEETADDAVVLQALAGAGALNDPALEDDRPRARARHGGRGPFCFATTNPASNNPLVVARFW